MAKTKNDSLGELTSIHEGIFRMGVVRTVVEWWLGERYVEINLTDIYNNTFRQEKKCVKVEAHVTPAIEKYNKGKTNKN